MSEAKFTNGIWEASADPLDYGLVRCDGFAVARGHSGSNIPYTEKIIANAHLIAAAPEMYELLNEARDFIASDPTIGPCGLGLVCVIDDLLAKARGEA